MTEDTKNRRFILWDTKDNYRPMTDEEGNQIISDGVLGRLTIDNVYLTTYANYHGDKRPKDLEVGECIKGVGFHLSGEHGVYDIYRVEDAERTQAPNENHDYFPKYPVGRLKGYYQEHRDLPKMEASFNGVCPPESVIVPREEWEEAKNREDDGKIHPCNSWNINECDCKGACSCHWRIPEKSLDLFSIGDKVTILWEGKVREGTVAQIGQRPPFFNHLMVDNHLMINGLHHWIPFHACRKKETDD